MTKTKSTEPTQVATQAETQPPSSHDQPPRAHRSPNLCKSIAGALFGIQSERNREIDFNQPHPLPFIVAGVVAIALFVAILVAISQWVSA